MSSLMTNGEFFQAVNGCIQDSEQHADLIALCRKAMVLQRAVLEFLNKYEDRDLAEESLGSPRLQLAKRQRSEYLAQIQNEIESWDHNAFGDVSGFNWTLNTFVSVVEGQIYGSLDDGSETDTHLDQSEDDTNSLIVHAA